MVLTIEKLNLQIKTLEAQYNAMLNGSTNAMINFAFNYQKQVADVKAKIQVISGQVIELIREEQKAKKLEEQKKVDTKELLKKEVKK